jgi:FtsH-binding integral membrane protein
VFDRNTNQSNVPPQSSGSPYGWAAPNTLSQGAAPIAAVVPREGFLTMSFVWMFLALLVSAGSAWFVMSNAQMLEKVAGAWLLLFIVEIGLVVAISGLINRIGALPALGLLFAYALINGLVLGLIVWAYTRGTGISGVVSAFAGASAIFAGAAIYGGVTKRDLTSLGGILFMGLLGLLVTMLVQVLLFPTSSALNLVIGVVGVLIFTGLTAWDVQRISRGAMPWIKNRESASVVGALALYLDFVNLFLFMLRIFGGTRN